MPKRKTNDQFVKELEIINSSIEPLEEYQTAATPLLCKCLICGYEWLGIPSNLLRGEGCLKCSGNQKLTTEEFIAQMESVNKEILITGDYVNSKTKISFICKKCGKEGSATPVSLKKGHGCKYCARVRNVNSRRHTNEWFLKKLEKCNPGITPLDEYSTLKTAVRFKCTCGNEDLATPSSLLKGRKCAECRKKGRSTLKRSTDGFLKELNTINPLVEPLEEYRGISEKIRCRCKICGNEWETSPHQLLIGRGCKKCKKRWQTSYPEQAVYFYLKSFFPETESSYREGFGNSELDIFIPSLHIGIEYDGMRWHKNSFEIEQRKYEICRQKKILLVRIRENPDGMDLKKICDHYIKTDYGTSKKAEALDCSIYELLSYLGVSCLREDINTSRDRIQILSLFYSELKDKSLAVVAPELAKEWYQPRNGNITPMMVRPGTNEPFYWKCPRCGYIYPSAVYSRMAGHGCGKCAGVLNKSQDQFIQEAKVANPSINVLGEYINASTKITIRCNRCGSIQESNPRVILNGGGCKYCGRKNSSISKMLSQEDFLNRVHLLFPDIEVLGNYEGSHIRIRCRCKKCKHEWDPVADSLVSGTTGCPNCAGNRKRKVICCETGVIYESMGKAEKMTGINHSGISQCCKGKTKLAGGYHWKYLDE